MFKPHAGKLVVRWVTTSESLLLYVFVLFSWVACLCIPYETLFYSIASTVGLYLISINSIANPRHISRVINRYKLTLYCTAVVTKDS
jgi:hypothetical protein